MSGPGRRTGAPLADTRALRLRTVALYHGHGRTQQDIAESLGISRTTVMRILSEARARGEVQIWIDATPPELAGLAQEVASRLDLERVILVPGSGTPEETALDVGAALGRFLSEAIADGMTVGVGWGRTLNAALRTFRPEHRPGVRVVSLLGGMVEAQDLNPIDFSWQMAARLQGECLLFLAPLLVDSAETKRRLIGACGLDQVIELAGTLDLAVVSCGEVAAEGSSLSRGFVPDADLAALAAAGAVCDCMCHFLDNAGRTVAHPIHDRVMSVDLDTVAQARHTVVASGGARRAAAIVAAVRRTRCRTLITDEAAATAIAAHGA